MENTGKPNRRRLDFYFDFLSPYAYLASHRLAEIAEKHNLQVVYHPIDLNQAKAAIGNVGPANRDLPIKLKYLAKDLTRWAARYGIPLEFVPNFNTELLNAGLFYAGRECREAEYVRSAYRLTWGAGRAPDDVEVLEELAREMGWSPSDFMAYIRSEEASRAYQASTEDAISRHVFGVPTMLMGGEMWWGNDRLDFLEERLNS